MRTETNTNWNHNNTKGELTNKSKKAFKNSAVNFSINDFDPEHKTNYQPGRCIHFCTNHWAGRIRERIDYPRRMGRWTGKKYRFKGERSLTIITVYHPCRYSHTRIQKATQTVHS
jgi:hypothetical protein